MVSPWLALSRRATGDDVCSCGQQEEEQEEPSGEVGGGGGGGDKEVRSSWHCILHEGVGTNDK